MDIHLNKTFMTLHSSERTIKQNYHVNGGYTHTPQNRVKWAKHFFPPRFVSFLLKCVPQTHRLNASSLQQAVQVLLGGLFFDVGGALLGAVGVVIVLQDCYDIMMAKMNGLVHGSVAPPVLGHRVNLTGF